MVTVQTQFILKNCNESEAPFSQTGSQLLFTPDRLGWFIRSWSEDTISIEIRHKVLLKIDMQLEGEFSFNISCGKAKLIILQIWLWQEFHAKK